MTASGDTVMETAPTMILVPSCDRYEQVATLTTRLISRFWDRHPPLALCGLSRSGHARLALRSDPADWMSVLRDAVEDLQGAGVRCCYLVLDDHPPLARCHARHLNRTLPALMPELSAACIGLNGWGPGREGRRPAGERLDGSRYRLEHLPAEYRWSFALHPALWSLDSLHALLEALIASLPPEHRSPWRFEREAVRAAGALPASVAREAYRVSGRDMTASRARRAIHLAALQGARAMRRATRGTGALHRALHYRVDLLGQYYDGPYPLFWSGAVQAGKPNHALLEFLSMIGRRALARELLAAAPGAAA